MWKILILLIWLVALIGMIIMKKIEPNNRKYPALALASAIIVTIACLSRIF